MSDPVAVLEPPEVEETVEAEPKFEFDAAFQRKVAALTVRDSMFMRRVEGLVRPDYFEHEADSALVRVVDEYYAVYRKAPDIAVLATLIKDSVASKKIRKDLVPGIRDRIKELIKTDVSDREFVVGKVAEFAQHRAMENAILACVPLLDKRDFKGIKKLMDAAVLVGAQDDDDDYDYFERVETRTEERKARAAGTLKRFGISTGFPDLDKFLYHEGWGRKELSVIMGAAKAGKSMSLGEFGKAASLMGFNVLYVSLEVAKEIIASRVDANISDTLMKELHLSPFDVQNKVKAAQAKAGAFKLRDFASGTFKVSQLRRLIQRYRSKGIIFDLIIVDYADLMAPEFRSDDHRENLRSIYVDLRAVAFEEDAALLTATQTNREGAKAMTAKATDVSEDWSKVMTADLFITINANEAEKASNEARLYIAASRNSEGDFQIQIMQDRARMKFIRKVLGRI